MPESPVKSRLFGLHTESNKLYKLYKPYSRRGGGLDAPAAAVIKRNHGDKILYVKVY